MFLFFTFSHIYKNFYEIVSSFSGQITILCSDTDQTSTHGKYIPYISFILLLVINSGWCWVQPL